MRRADAARGLRASTRRPSPTRASRSPADVTHLRHNRLGRALATHVAHRRLGRPHELDARRLARAREGLVLGEKAVPGVHRARARAHRDVQDCVRAQVRLGGWRGADAVRLVGLRVSSEGGGCAYMRRPRVRRQALEDWRRKLARAHVRCPRKRTATTRTTWRHHGQRSSAYAYARSPQHSGCTTDHRNVLCARVRVRVHGDSLDAQAARGAHDSACDLAAIGD